MFSAANNDNFNKIKVLFHYVQVCSHNDNYMVQIFPPRQLLSYDQSMNHCHIIKYTCKMGQYFHTQK